MPGYDVHEAIYLNVEIHHPSNIGLGPWVGPI